MPAKAKIIGELAVRVLKYHSDGLNPHAIGKEIGVAKDTVKSFLKSQNLTPNNRKDVSNSEVYQKFIEMVKSGKDFTNTRKEFGISYKKAVQQLELNGITPRNRTTAAKDKRLTEEQVLARLKSENQTFAGMEGNRYKIVDNTNGNIWLKKGARLTRDRFTRKANVSKDDIERRLTQHGYTLVSILESKRGLSHSTVVATCPKGHVRTTRFLHFFYQECASCSNTGVSNVELELLSAIQEFWPSACKYKFEERVTRPKEIDIYIPELKLGIEFCGLYSHSIEEDAEIKVLSPSLSEEDRVKLQKKIDQGEQKHYTKMLMAQKAGIDLITVFDDEWINRHQQVWSYIKSKMLIFDHILHGRKCQVKEIDKVTGNDFIEQYHIQGSELNSNRFFGLFTGDELLSVMSFGNHPRKNGTPTEIYLNRYAVKASIKVHGGASKLFKHALPILRQLGFSTVVSWSDNRWSSGKVYKALGFGLSIPSRANGSRMGLKDGSIWPEKLYVIGARTVSAAKAKQFKARIPDLQARIIYDCGKKRWVFPLT
jgi:hypothetical protein